MRKPSGLCAQQFEAVKAYWSRWLHEDSHSVPRGLSKILKSRTLRKVRTKTKINCLATYDYGILLDIGRF